MNDYDDIGDCCCEKAGDNDNDDDYDGIGDCDNDNDKDYCNTMIM